MRRMHRLFSVAVLLASSVATSTALAQDPALVTFSPFGGATGGPAGSATTSAGWTFFVNQTVTVEALGAMFTTNALNPLADQEVGVFAEGSTTPLFSAVVTPTASIVRPSPSGDARNEYRYVAVTPFDLLAGNTYTLFAAPVAGSAETLFTWRELVRDLVLDPRLSWVESAFGFDDPDDANDGVAYDTYSPFSSLVYPPVAGPDFLIAAATAVPEPSAMALVASGLFIIAGATRRRRAD